VALKSFRVENEKGLHLATCETVPRVMVIAGPNGVGKSTLLYALHRRQGAVYEEGTAPPIYQPPHRAIRSQQVRRRWLGLFRPLLDIFSSSDVGGFEGLSIQFPARTPGNVDEAGSTIKYTLGRIENRRQAILASLVDEHSKSGSPIQTDKLPDIYGPIRTLTSTLLPHLSFRRVDFSNEESIRCVFERTDVVGTDDLDLDDLSSGEKSIFLLFLPLIENEITRLLDALERGGAGGATVDAAPDRVFLIDEPEQHLHPDLQARILGYFRDEAARQSIQFVITTHSPTLVDQAFDSELYLLSFPEGPGTNQLRRVATSVDRLEAIRALTGNTYVVTTGRSIICVEGARDSTTKPTDVGLLGILCPRATRYTFVPVGGKGNVIRVVQELREHLSEEHFGIKVFGIVDRDRAYATTEGIVPWDVASIENLLLDAEATAACVNELANSRGTTAADIIGLLQEAGMSQSDDEIRLRVMDAIGARTVRIKGVSVDEVKDAIAQERRHLELSDDQITEVIRAATAVVDAALADGSYLKNFRGKSLLRGIYQRLSLADDGISYDRFCYALAGQCADRADIRALIDAVFDQLEGPEPAV
jgi:hypothetical protein